jgi:hypothetical protein
VRRNSQLGNTQAHLDNAQNTSQYFQTNRAIAGQRSTNGTYDASLGQRHSEGTINPYTHQARSSDEISQPRNSIGSWNNSGSLQSPTDEHRGRSSYNTSRENSLPPSRNGNDYQNTDLFSMARLGQTAMTMPSQPRHNSSISSLSNGRFPMERQNSHSDALPNLLSQMSLTNSQNSSSQVRPQNNAQSPQELYARNLSSFANTYDETALNNGAGPFTAPAFQDPFQPQNSRFGERGALTANANDNRWNLNGSAGASSQIYDSSYPYVDHAQPYANNYDQLELARRLHSLQQLQQPRQRMMQHAPYQPTRMNPHQPRFRSYDAQQYGMLPMTVPLPVMPMPAPMPLLPPSNYTANEIPRGPRGEAEVGDRIQSPILAEYKATQKSNARRWELKVRNNHYYERSSATNLSIGYLWPCCRIQWRPTGLTVYSTTTGNCQQ